MFEYESFLHVMLATVAAAYILLKKIAKGC
jgi:hypothetical protein